MKNWSHKNYQKFLKELDRQEQVQANKQLKEKFEKKEGEIK
jgi:hypothetical protein